MDAVTEQPRSRTKKRINYALAATLISSGVTLNDAAPEVGAKDANSLRVGLARRGVTVGLCRAKTPLEGNINSVALRVATRASELLRGDVENILQSHVGKLKDIPAKANLKHIKAVGDALEPLVRSAKIVHGWGSETEDGLVRKARFVEIESSCAQEAATSGVPEQKQIEHTPQAEQAVESKPAAEQS